MLSPRSIRLFLKYFDSIDQALSKRLVRKRTWDEEALTFLLTELLDEEGQLDHRVTYPHNTFVKDLSATDEPLSVSVLLETHSYPKSMERFVTQSDIGFILSYEDQFDRNASFHRAWLLQAKRLFPTRQSFENGFTASSQFESIDAAQHARMKRLRDWAQYDFIRYLLYCPRPSDIQKNAREYLSAARARAIGRDIFDFSMGLELRDDLLSGSPTIAAGIFVARIDNLPESLLAVHASLFRGVLPFSWFIVSQLAQSDAIRGSREFDEYVRSGRNPEQNVNNPLVDGLIRGDIDVISRDGSLLEVLDEAERARLLPAHTLTVKVINGIERPGN